MSAAEPGEPGDVTRLLHQIRDGDQEALDRLIPLIYGELKRVARAVLRREVREQTLQATALVHEAYMKLADQARVDWQSRAHFYAVASRAMRQVLIDEARKRKAEKRGGEWRRTTLDGKPIGLPEASEELLELDEALDRLNEVDERLRKVVECRYFGGMTEEEIAEVLGVSKRSVQRDWVKARAWLYNELYSAE